MEKGMWVCFYHNGRMLLKYSLKGEAPGERRETIGLLAYQHNIPEESVTVKLLWL